jgi:DNA-directed RNA polymerase specialized sigma24 family protein
MSDDGSITRLIADLKNGQEVTRARQEIWDRYFHRLVALARAKLQGVRRTVEDEEDVALSVLNSLFVRIGEQRFPLLQDRNHLWPLLVKITACKAVNMRQRVQAAKRGGGRVVRGDSAFLPGPQDDIYRQIDDVVAREPTPQFAAEVVEQYQRLLAVLPDGAMRLVAQRKVEGYSHQDIARELGVVERTVERKLKLVRQIWQRELDDSVALLQFPTDDESDSGGPDASGCTCD